MNQTQMTLLRPKDTSSLSRFLLLSHKDSYILVDPLSLITKVQHLEHYLFIVHGLSSGSNLRTFYFFCGDCRIRMNTREG